jgi:hypothetical protein
VHDVIIPVQHVVPILLTVINALHRQEDQLPVVTASQGIMIQGFHYVQLAHISAQLVLLHQVTVQLALRLEVVLLVVIVWMVIIKTDNLLVLHAIIPV